MTDYAIAAAAIIAAGAWLRFGVVPVAIAYEIGRRVERLRLRRQAR